MGPLNGGPFFKMRIGVYGYQDEANAETLWAFCAGAIALDLQPVWRAPIGNELEPFDAVAIFGLRPRRKVFADMYMAKGVPVFVIENGHLRREDGFWQIGLDRLNWLPDFECDSERFDSLELPLESEEAEHGILIVGQKPDDAQHGLSKDALVAEVQRWVNEAQQYEAPIIYRPHPEFVNAVIPEGIDETYTGPLEDLWPRINRVVTHNSNLGNLALLKGKEVTCHPSAMYYDVTQGAMTREQYFNRLAMTNWHIDEIGSGLALNFYLKVIAGE